MTDMTEEEKQVDSYQSWKVAQNAMRVRWLGERAIEETIFSFSVMLLEAKIIILGEALCQL